VAAIGKRAHLLGLKNSPFEMTENGVFWYAHNYMSNGFAPENNVRLNSADTNNANAEKRLSWHLGQSVGGWRAGATTSLNGDGTWQKVVMYGPCTDLYGPPNPPAVVGATTMTAQCKADGAFDKAAGCLPVNCGPAPVELGATRDDGDIKFGTDKKYTCESGFSIGGAKDGASTFEVGCESNGEFSIPSPDMICVNIDDCVGHTCGAHGYCYDLINDYGCKCDDGFEENEVDGEKICGNIDDCGGHSCGQGNCIDLVGDYMCECDTGYSQEFVDGGEKTCLPVRCADTPPSPAHASLIGGGSAGQPVRYPNTLTYKCNDDYSLDGTGSFNSKRFSVTCSINGAMEALSSCQKIRCGNPPQTMNAYLTSPNMYATVYAGDTASYNCATGHKIGGNGAGASSFNVKCKGSGYFTPVSSCEPVVCGSAPGQNYANVNWYGAITYGMTITYSCYGGFSINQVSGGPTTFRKTCQANGQFSGAHNFIQIDTAAEGADNEQDLKNVENTTTQETKNLSFLQASADTEMEGEVDGDEDFDSWDDDEEDIAEDDLSLLQEESTSGKSGEKDAATWGRRRRDRRRRTRRRRCTTPTSTSTGYFGCHPHFNPPPCVQDVAWNWDWLNPFKPGGWDWFALMQKGEDSQAHGALKIIKYGTLHAKKRQEAELIIGDTISFSCPPGHTITGDPNGARGAVLLVTANGIVDQVTGGAAPEGCEPVTFTVIGQVTSSRTGLPVAGVKVTIGDLESTTSEAGIYDIEGVMEGATELSFDKEGFYTDSLDVNVVGNTEIGGVADKTIMPKLTEDEWAFELTWDTDDDLDVEATWADKRVYFGEQTATGAGITVKFLKDAPKKGPETVLASNVGSCTLDPEAYHCHLEMKVKSDSNMESSGAKAVLWNGLTEVGEFKISDCLTDVTESGTWWHVFTLNTKTNTLVWTCNGIAGAASLLQETAMSIPVKHSANDVHARRHAIDYTSYVGPFPGRFFRHSIKRSKNRTSAVGQKFLPVPSPSKKAASLANVKTVHKPSKRNSTSAVVSRQAPKATVVRPSNVISNASPADDPNWRIIKGKVVYEAHKPLHPATSASTDAKQHLSKTQRSAFGASLISSSTSADVSLKVEPSEVDVRPRTTHTDTKTISRHIASEK
jgi:hypothetical protein